MRASCFARAISRQEVEGNGHILDTGVKCENEMERTLERSALLATSETRSAAKEGAKGWVWVWTRRLMGLTDNAIYMATLHEASRVTSISRSYRPKAGAVSNLR